MSFPKSQKTFGESAGRMGMPSARKPMVKNAAKRQNITGGARMSQKPKAGKLKGAAGAAPTARKPRTSKLKGKVNSFRTAKAAPLGKKVKARSKTGGYAMSKRTKGTNPQQDSIDTRLGSYFSGIKGGF